jgi:FMN phosphatase YigB (HAD superfamily)
MTLKIVSDFDGVWTDQAFEAEEVKLFLAAEAARFAGVGADQARRDFLAFESAVLARPSEYGWAPDGRITAYVDEDPFCVANSIAAYLERGADPRAQRYREAILEAGEPSLSAFADRCFLSSTARFRELHPPALVPSTQATLEALRARGVEIVVVSNSSSEKIVGWFRQVGVDAGVEPHAALRVRGQAGKQVLGPGDEHLVLAGRRISVDRPRYRAVLEEERPDLVIGDVFSLDLALPHVLRRSRAAGAPRTLVLRRHPHTPEWVLATRADGAIDRVVDDVAELLALVDAQR